MAVSSLNATFATSGQTRVAAFNGTADFTGLTVRAPTRATPYTLRFLPSNTSVPGIGTAAGTLDVTPASLNVVIQPCITGGHPVQHGLQGLSLLHGPPENQKQKQKAKLYNC